MSKLVYMNRQGDKESYWDPKDLVSMIKPRLEFDEAIKKGALAFTVKGLGLPATQISEFDPEAEEILIVPAMAGGN